MLQTTMLSVIFFFSYNKGQRKYDLFVHKTT